MKKIIILLASVFVFGVFFVSCSKRIDASTWIDNLSDAKQAAAQQKKDIFIFFSSDEDEISKKLKENVFSTDQFISTFSKEYILANLDFSNSLFEKTQILPEDDDETQKAAFKLQEKISENMKTAQVYNVASSPTFLIMSKEGYVITQIAFEENSSFDDVVQTFNDNSQKIADFKKNLEKTSKGSKEEKIKAIDDIFEWTDYSYRYAILPLSQKLIALDKNNSSGLVGKYIIAVANAKAVDAFLNDDINTAVESFAEIGTNEFLTTEEKQQVYYMAAYVLAQSGSQDYEKIRNYFQASYDIDPESEYAEQILTMIKIVNEREAEYETENEEIRQSLATPSN